jgi:hypothetical protein
VEDTKATRRTAASSIDFRKELNLPFASLGTLGARIEAARRAPDPVALGNAANELAVAEKVSGKKASLTSSALLQEATELAKLRRQVKELQAMMQLKAQVATEDKSIQDLQTLITQYTQDAKQETEAVQQNQEPTGPRTVLINNYSAQYVDLWVNGYLKAQIGPGESKSCVIEHKWNPTVLNVYGNDDSQTWAPRTIWGNFKTYTWNLYGG